MLKDSYGLAISTSSAPAAAAFDLTIESYLKAGLDARDHLARALSADAHFGLVDCLKAYMDILLYRKVALLAAVQAASIARVLMAEDLGSTTFFAKRKRNGVPANPLLSCCL